VVSPQPSSQPVAKMAVKELLTDFNEARLSR
jgi:hypothetical protein